MDYDQGLCVLQGTLGSSGTPEIPLKLLRLEGTGPGPGSETATWLGYLDQHIAWNQLQAWEKERVEVEEIRRLKRGGGKLRVSM